MAELDATKLAEKATATAETDWDDILGGDDDDGQAAATEPVPELRRPALIRITAAILIDESASPTGRSVDIAAGTEVDRLEIDDDGDVWIATDPDSPDDFNLALEADEYEVLRWEGDEPVATDTTPPATAAEAADPSPQQTVQQQLDASEEWQQAVREARATVRIRESEFEAAREEARRAKKDWEAAMKELCDVIDGKPGRMPLFDGPRQTAAPAEASTDEPAAEPQAVEEDDSWKFIPISQLIEYGLSAGIVEILAANPEMPINTIGHLTDWSEAKKDYGSPLTMIPKVGKGKAEKIENALLKFWDARKG